MRLVSWLMVGAPLAFAGTAIDTGAHEHTHPDHRATAGPSPVATAAVPNDNRVPAGKMVGDTLYVRLTLSAADWHILSDSAPAFTVAAFQEEGKPPSIPAPLIRARVGTPIRVEIRNPLDDTLVVRGLTELTPAGAGDLRLEFGTPKSNGAIQVAGVVRLSVAKR